MPVQTCPDCGAKIGGKKEPQRIDRRGALEAWNNLSDRQREPVWFLYRFRLASQQQIANALYTLTDPKNRLNKAKNCLNYLQKLNLVYPLAGGAKTNGKRFYTLTDEGNFCCQAEEKAGGKHVRKIKGLRAAELLDSPAWKHHYYLVDVMASFVRAERAGLGELVYFCGDGEVDYKFLAPSIGTKHLRPDSTIMWSDGGPRPYLCWLELEHKHATLNDFVEKVSKYVRFSRAGSQPGDTYKIATGQNEFPVLLIVAVKGSQYDPDHQGQLPGLRQSIVRGVLAGAGGETLPNLSRRVVIGLAALDDIRERGVLTDIWQPVLQGTARGLTSFTGLFDLR